ncbi:MAG TPA: DUF397 domain-containing protein [Pseudonocardiaceae bacterium]|jgi:hypothetical protein|nr:DUF397 domain-containing protein [Pseudonocardiaceae bacterium]
MEETSVFGPWRKSSYSGNSANCVEVAPSIVFGPWHKSSYSGNSANCVEVAPSAKQVAIRDSKNPTGPTITTSAFAAFLADTKADRFDR